jgi:hypothetical protein
MLLACDDFDAKAATAAFERSATMARNWHGRTDYELVIRGDDGEGDPPIIVSIFQRAVPGEARVDFTDEESKISIFFSSTDEAACSTDPADLSLALKKDTGGACVSRVPGEGTSAGNYALLLALTFSYVLSDDRDTGVTVSAVWDDRVMEQDAKCYGFGDSGAELSFCFAEDGQLVRLGAQLPGGRLMCDATNATIVSDADFERPYPVVDKG